MTSWSRRVFANNGNAVASVLLGVAGLLAFGVILGPIAVGLGLMAKAQIRRRPQPGSGPASIGIAIGVVAFVVPIALLLRS